MMVELTAADFAAVWQLEMVAHGFPWSQNIMEKQLQKRHCNFGLMQENRLVAMAMLQRIFPETELLNIAVMPDQQGLGLGKQLLTQIIQMLEQEKYQSLFLEVRASNQRAIRLYESLGFNQIGERRAYYPAKTGREDALLYAKELLAVTAKKL